MKTEDVSQIITRTGAEFQTMTNQEPRKMMSLNATSGYCAPVTLDEIGFPPLQEDCFYNIRRVTTIDNDTGCIIDILYIHVSHWCETDGEGSGTATASASGSHDDDPPYGGGGFNLGWFGNTLSYKGLNLIYHEESMCINNCFYYLFGSW